MVFNDVLGLLKVWLDGSKEEQPVHEQEEQVPNFIAMI